MRRTSKQQKRQAQITRREKRASRTRRRLMGYVAKQPFIQPPMFYIMSAVMAVGVLGMVIVSILAWYGTIEEWEPAFNAVGLTLIAVVFTLGFGSIGINWYKVHQRWKERQLQET